MPEDSGAHAHTFRIRIDAEGTSATAVEQHFGLTHARIQRVLDIPVHVVGQVIEMTDNKQDCRQSVDKADGSSPWVGSWYKGRLILAPDHASQGCHIDGDREFIDGDNNRVGSTG